MLRQRGPGKDNHSSPITNGTSRLRNPALDDTTYLLILIVIAVPIIFTLILCTIAYCIYRYNKKRTENAPTNATIVPVDRTGLSTATIIYNTQHSPFIFEDSPPTYNSLVDTKKNMNEQYPLTQLSNITNTNINEGGTTSTAAAILPSAPTPPPSYKNLDVTNQS